MVLENEISSLKLEEDKPMLPERVLIVGGSYGGFSALRTFVNMAAARDPASKPISITLLEPRAGFINILGIPKSILDLEFADRIFAKLEDCNLPFSDVKSKNEALVNKIQALKVKKIPNMDINFIQGRCQEVRETHATYRLVDEDPLVEASKVEFDYCIYATGRKRLRPFDPAATTSSEFVAEMASSLKTIEKAKTISIIGGGALGIEIAGELKQDYGDEKVVRLIHPYHNLPPEKNLEDEYKEKLKGLLEKVKVELYLGKRVSQELENGDIILNDGQKLASDLNYWCNSHSNNVEPLDDVYGDCIDEKNRELNLLPTLQFKSLKDDSKVFKNMFAIGDIVNFPIKKTAGGAFHMGILAAKNIINSVDSKELEELPLATWPKGMAITVGNANVIAQHDSKVLVNDPEILEMYEDYCTKRNLVLFDIDY